ncbi:unnamed protein product [Peronospora belbahrii]|uniref:Uncharacterized protein n=1 Tax=Peronospora belbahrii TaxID=622444 RepID=A0AAU9L3P9_9STRA|nr:unnamed protein product [Peronospora belbahrii]
MDQGRLRSQQQEAERLARELMDVKIEAAHLRERLRMRVGGDTTAVELEAETFALQTALNEAQEILKERQVALETVKMKYEQAMRGMIRLDEAWNSSRKEIVAVQEARGVMEQELNDEKRRNNALQNEVKAGIDREMILNTRVEELRQEKEEIEKVREKEKEEMKQREKEIQELRVQLEITRQKFDTQMKQQEGATREDVRKLQEQLQQNREEAAAVRGEFFARQEEAIKIQAELRDTKAAEVATKQRLIKLTEECAALRVHLESAKGVAVESTQKAIQLETENDSMRKELEERDDVLAEKKKNMRTLEEELVQMQKMMEVELSKKKKAAEEMQQRLMMESQEMLQAQEETWSCREKSLQQEIEHYKQELICVQALHVELAQLLQKQNGDCTTVEQLQSIKPALLKALVVQEINKRDVLTSTVEQMKIQLGTAKRQLGSLKQLETKHVKLRNEYEKAKLAMERMATRKAKSVASIASLPVQPAGHGSSSSSEKSAGKENRPGEDGDVAPMVKRKLQPSETDTPAFKTTPQKGKAQRTKHVYVASRYLGSASKR